MMLFKLISVACLATLASTQDYQDFQNVGRQAPLRLSSSNEPKPTPVPILKQINRHNEDGSYTYGYEGADGSFKIETKLATGEVKGKYGYTDETGKVRIVEYGANKYGFQPSGEGITVAPPTLVDETTDKNGNLLPDYEDEPVQRAPAPKYRPQKAPRPISPPQQQQYYEYETQPIQQNYQHQPAAPKYTAPIAPSTRISAPAPPRLQIPGAQQAPLDVVYSKTPRPARFDDYEDVGPQTFPQQQQHQPQARKDAFPAQLFTQAAPSPPKQNQVAYQAPRLQQAPQNFAPQGRSSGGGVLDQLAKDYALPSGGTPLHDISFGYY
ncbi:fibrous sheath CABYR-binding protein [Culicoides brevitarsis]|uniref:fibrous sheath CABYR-binding protein n=1 Tax=Culicoides brevitarsis TaxID=469753 RepID=UPI00307C8DE4